MGQVQFQVFLHITHLILMITIRKAIVIFPFTDKETEAEKLSNLPKVTKLIS